MTQLMRSAAKLLGFLNTAAFEKKSQILSQMNQLIWFHWAVTWVNYCIFSATTQKTFIALINSGIKK